MPHKITNRRRSYKRFGPRDSGFFWEGLSALAYIAGAATFLIGSIFFLPALEQYAAAGAWLFILGSAIYLVVTVADLVETIIHYRQHKPHGGSKVVLEFITSGGYVAGCILFLIGSAFFIPMVGLKAWGGWCFIVGSALFAAGACVNITQITQAGSLLALQLLNAVAICFVVGSVLFFVGSVPYLWQDMSLQDNRTLFSYLGAEYIVGSLLFLVGGLVNFYRAYTVHRQHNPNG